MAIALGVVGAVAAYTRIPEKYATSASLVVLSPTRPVNVGAEVSAEDTPEINPFLAFSGSQEIAAQVLQIRMADDDVGESLAEQGVLGTWDVAVTGGSGPLIEVTAEEATPEQADATAQLVVDRAIEEFAALQREAGSPDDQLIQISVVNDPAAPQPVRQEKVRSAALVLALGIATAVGLPVLLEGLAQARRRRRVARGVPGEADGGDAAGGDHEREGGGAAGSEDDRSAAGGGPVVVDDDRSPEGGGADDDRSPGDAGADDDRSPGEAGADDDRSPEGGGADDDRSPDEGGADDVLDPPAAEEVGAAAEDRARNGRAAPERVGALGRVERELGRIERERAHLAAGLSAERPGHLAPGGIFPVAGPGLAG